MRREESENMTEDEVRELDKSQIIWTVVRSANFIPSVDGKTTRAYFIYTLKGPIWLLCRVQNVR